MLAGNVVVLFCACWEGMTKVKSTFSFASVSSSGLCESEGKGASHEMESGSHIILKFLLRAFRNHLGGWLSDLKMKESKLSSSSLRKPKSSEGWTQSLCELRRFAPRAVPALSPKPDSRDCLELLEQSIPTVL